MKTRSIFTTLVFAVLFTGAFTLKAQQTPKKTTAPKSTAKTTAPKKKPITKKTGNVFICDGVGGYFYHSHAACGVLKKCKGRILNVPKQEAIGQYSTKQCKKCF